MFFTRSIRRKMVLGLALVLVMLLALSLSGISGMLSYRNVVNDLNYSINHAPRGSELSAAVSLLFEPLVGPMDDTPQSARLQQLQFQQSLAKARERVRTFRRKLEEMPPSREAALQRPAIESLLAQVFQRLDGLAWQSRHLSEPRRRRQVAAFMLEEVARLETLVQKVPDPEAGLSETLAQARRVYHSRFWMLSVSSALVVLLFMGLIWCGYRWVFSPIRQLHRGARRVAQGDFAYRLELTSHDEMAELADAFNSMTARFQEIASELDWQLQQRTLELIRSERMAAVGCLAAEVAHEINNPLAVIVMTAESLRGRFQELLHGPDVDQSDVMQQYVEMIQKEGDRCQQITSRMLSFSRAQPSDRQAYDLAVLVDEVVEMMRVMGRTRDRSIVVRRTLPCRAVVDGGEIKQVILNLVVNALDSMREGGTLTIELVDRAGQVVLTFADDGCGMTQDVLDRLFEPFFTQKESGKGTGLGLSVSRRIVTNHGGRIEASSEGPGRGSTFRVVLPHELAATDAAA